MKYFFALLLASATFAQSATPDIDTVLDRLDAAGKNLRSFTASVKTSDADPDTGDANDRTGQVWYALDTAGNPRIHVQLLRRISDGKSINDPIDYLLAGTDLIIRNERLKSQSTRHLLRPGEKVDLFKLGSGPFPLPIGQSKADVHAAFDVTAIAPAAGDPPDADHLRLLPNPGTRLARDFKSIDVWADRMTGMPGRIVTLAQRGDSSRTTDLTDVHVNEPVDEKHFTLPEIDKGEWQVSEDEYQR